MGSCFACLAVGSGATQDRRVPRVACTCAWVKSGAAQGQEAQLLTGLIPRPQLSFRETIP